MSVDRPAPTYEWVDPWADPPEATLAATSWPHTAIAFSRRHGVLTFHPVRSAIVSFERSGRFVRSIPAPVREAHGMTLVEEAGGEALWLADASRKLTPENDYCPSEGSPDSAVVLVDLDGNVRRSLAMPPHPSYRGGHFRPTGIAVDEPRFGGSGDLWVADGYGESLVHRYDSEARYVASLSGEEGAGRFRGPHAVFVDRRRGEPELYVADRANARIQVYDLGGRFRRVVGVGILSTPTALAVDGDRLLVLEFRPPRLTVLDRDDQLLTYVGENPAPPAQKGFPFVRADNGRPCLPARMGPGRFGVPHGIAVDDEGSLYVTQVVFGSRLTKLVRAPGSIGEAPVG